MFDRQMRAALLAPQAFDRRFYRERRATGRQLQLPTAPTQQMPCGQHALQLARDGLAGIEQLDTGRQTLRDGRRHPGVMRATKRHDIDPGRRQRADKAIQQVSPLRRFPVRAFRSLRPVPGKPGRLPRRWLA
jgi:hypothetical protein